MTTDGAPDRSDGSYQERLGQILRLRDPDALRAFLVEQARRFADDRQVEAVNLQSDAELELIMHRMILARNDLADLQAASRAALGTDSALQERTSRSRRKRR
jgi:hypothetical protein